MLLGSGFSDLGKGASLVVPPSGSDFDVEIDHDLITSDLTDIPFPIDLSTAPAAFWSGVQVNGGNIRAFVGEIAIPLAVIRVDKTQEIGEIIVLVPAILAATDTLITLRLLSEPSTQPATSDPLGRDAVGSALDAMWLGGEHVADFAGGGDWDIHGDPFQFEDLGILHTFSRHFHQGLVHDPITGDWIGIDTLYIERMNAAFVTQTSNSDLCGDVETAQGLGSGDLYHIGDGCIVGDYLILPVNDWPEITKAYLVVVDKTTLAYVNSVEVTAQTTIQSGVCWNDVESRIVAIEWTANTGGVHDLWKYTITGSTIVFDTSISLTIPVSLERAQSIEFWNGAYWINNDELDETIRIGADGVGDSQGGFFGVSNAGNYEGITVFEDSLVVTIDPGGSNTFIQRFRPYSLPLSAGGGAFKNGGTSYFDLAVPAGASSFAIGCTFNPFVDQQQAIVSFLQDGGPNSNDRVSIAVRSRNGERRVAVWDGNSGNGWTPPNDDFEDVPVAVVGAPHRVWVLYDASALTITIYQDGALVHTRTGISLNWSLYDTLNIGRDDDDNNEVFDGFLGYVCLKRGVLPTAEEIAFEYLALNDPATLYTFSAA